MAESSTTPSPAATTEQQQQQQMTRSQAALASPSSQRRDAMASEEVPRARYLAPLCGGLGATAMGIYNQLRRRPLMYQPWWHVISALTGWSIGNWLGRLYDDTSDELNRQWAGVGRLPSWMHGKLSEDELLAEKRLELQAEYNTKWQQLAKLEEKEFIEHKEKMIAKKREEAKAAAAEKAKQLQ